MIYGEFEYGSTEYGSYLTPGSIYEQSCSSSITLSSLLSNGPGKNVTSSNAITASYIKSFIKEISFDEAISHAINKDTYTNLNTSVSPSIVSLLHPQKNLDWSFSLSEENVKSLFKISTATISLDSSISDDIRKALSLSASLSKSYTKNINSAKTESVTEEDTNAKEVISRRTSEFSVSASYSKISSFVKELSANGTITDIKNINNIFNRSSLENIIASDSLTVSAIKSLSEQFYLSVILYAYFETLVSNYETLSISEQKTIMSVFERLMSMSVSVETLYSSVSEFYRSNTESASISELIDLSKRFGKEESLDISEQNNKDIFQNLSVPMNFEILLTTPYFRWFYDYPVLTENNIRVSEFKRHIEFQMSTLVDKTVEYLFGVFSENVSATIDYQKEIHKDYQYTLVTTIDKILEYYKNFAYDLSIAEDIHGGGRRWFSDSISVSEANEKLYELADDELLAVDQSDLQYFAERALNNIESLNIALATIKHIETLKDDLLSPAESIETRKLLLKQLIENTLISSLLDLSKQQYFGKLIISKTLKSKSILRTSRNKNVLNSSIDRAQTVAVNNNPALKTSNRVAKLLNDKRQASLKTQSKIELWSDKI